MPSIIKSVCSFLVLVLIASCSKKPDHDVHYFKDPHSYARPAEAVVTHLNLDVNVDFTAKQITGKASYQIKNKNGSEVIRLDTRGLAIHKVTLGKEETNTPFTFGDSSAYLGRELKITIKPKTDWINIYYSTTDNADALQWLEPSQTAGKTKPFLFTQSQPILARTWIPCQDSPGIRMTYHAKIQCPPDLLAVMSAENATVKNSSGIYECDMPQPVPSYLLALAVGDIEFRPLGKRSGVYAEPAMVEKAALEFADTEKMMETAEKLYGPYRWGRYDIIVLPPSFPFGGMENPRLTFATPTIIAGDRSLVSLIAHELAHSWSGNLVTNATWSDAWLNEGFTMYFERRIDEELYGKEFAEMEALLGFQDLQEAMTELKDHPEDTPLFVDFAKRNPDDISYGIIYEKGYLFLRMMEEHIGREKWDAFLNEYFNTFAFKPMITERFVNYVNEELVKKDSTLSKKLKMDQWIYGLGIPDNCPVITSDTFQKVDVQMKAWLNGTTADQLETKDWLSHQWIHFVRNLPEKMSRTQMDELDRVFGFSKSGNSEIAFAWLIHVINNDYVPAYAQLENFLMNIGRRKFVEPLYTRLAKSQNGLELAKKIYRNARSSYHSITYLTVDKILFPTNK
ncbi:M1 family metallopeptidase [bacterium]|nr:M1 family metallopeptidase [bacterium]